jgi:sulfur carrier protein
MSHPEVERAATMDEVFVNGVAVRLCRGSTVADLVAERGLVGRRFAVEVNGAIVPRSLHPSRVLETGDRAEIVVAVGGG